MMTFTTSVELWTSWNILLILKENPYIEFDFGAVNRSRNKK